MILVLFLFSILGHVLVRLLVLVHNLEAAATTEGQKAVSLQHTFSLLRLSHARGNAALSLAYLNTTAFRSYFQSRVTVRTAWAGGM
jgi:hypothetical protein